MTIRRALGVVAVYTVLAACSMQPSIPPNVTIEDAHSGGNMVAFSPNGRLLASVGWDGQARVWGLPDGAMLASWQAHDGDATGVAFVSEQALVTGGEDGRVAKWRSDGVLVSEVETPSSVRYLAVDGTLLVTGHRDGTVRRWDALSLTVQSGSPIHDGAVHAVAAHQASGFTASSGTDGRVFLVDADGRIRELERPPVDAWTLIFSPDGNRLSGGGWFKLYNWDTKEGAIDVRDTPHWGIVKGMDYLPDGQTLATISRQTDSSVHFINGESGELVERYKAAPLCGADVRVSPDGRYLATTSDDASVRIWDREHLQSSTIGAN